MPEASIAAPTPFYLDSPSRRPGDVENQLQFPFGISPSSTGINHRLHLLFLTTMGWYVLGHIDVEEFLWDMETNWEKHNTRFREAVSQITTADWSLVCVLHF